MASACSTRRLLSGRQKWKEVPSLRCSAMQTLSSTVSAPKVAEIWNERTMPMRASAAADSRDTSWSSKLMVPPVGSRKRVRRLKSVVLPAPFGPITAWMLPRRTFRFTPSTAVKPLKLRLRSCVCRTYSLAGEAACISGHRQRKDGIQGRSLFQLQHALDDLGRGFFADHACRVPHELGD